MQNQGISKEALFNEVKGSLFEYLVALNLAKQSNLELDFIQSIDKNYFNVLTQQDRMIRKFYPEMLSFLMGVAQKTSHQIFQYFKNESVRPILCGKISQSNEEEDLFETDLKLIYDTREELVSLKLNKKSSYVNTKSGGIKSFFSNYFSFVGSSVQEEFNRFIDLEFERMSRELHNLHGLEYTGSYRAWVSSGLSELPGELDTESRNILKSYYARIALRMHEIFERIIQNNKNELTKSLPALMGFSSDKIIQVTCFHDFKGGGEPIITIHSLNEVLNKNDIELIPFHQVASVEFKTNNWSLQVRVKPMNKFTTTAMKINCSLKYLGNL